MKNLLFILLLPTLSFCQGKLVKKADNSKTTSPGGTASHPSQNGFTISGNVVGLTDAEVKISSPQGDKILAKGIAKDNVFAIKGSVDEPGLYWLTMGREQPQYIFLENSPIKITGTRADVKKLKVEGSLSHNDFIEFKKIFDPIMGNLNAIAAEIGQASESKKEGLMTKYRDAVTRLNKEVGNFVAAKRSSFVSLFLLSVTMQANENVAEVEQRFNMLDPKVKASVTAKDLINYLAYAKVGSVGSEALEFTQNDITDKPVSLSSFKGKYVLVDFWASWCRPCRQENPNVVRVFNKFKGKNFTVLGVSLDQQKEAWLKAIEKDNLSWTHVSDLQQWNNAVAQLYRVQSIPQNFLIDPNGKIVAKDLRGPDLEKKLCEYLGCSN